MRISQTHTLQSWDVSDRINHTDGHVSPDHPQRRSCQDRISHNTIGAPGDRCVLFTGALGKQVCAWLRPELLASTCTPSCREPLVSRCARKMEAVHSR
ncbi:hypothetical protein PCASD_14924 [Puccinia coronata f. sp. avenae]|uniref:Uncharacterized protein n=1 Tax=Puccinia coronata f. sp. avenae TaxID=200324 RepID=A0A2N5TEV7_9BASI|nr:hypothetical protein PCASD_14924 [Puccinia coronata f. sp. avenae]